MTARLNNAAENGAGEQPAPGDEPAAAMAVICAADQLAEITPAAAHACKLLANAGIPLGCQRVLLKGVNDDSATMLHLAAFSHFYHPQNSICYACWLSKMRGPCGKRNPPGVNRH